MPHVITVCTIAAITGSVLVRSIKAVGKVSAKTSRRSSMLTRSESVEDRPPTSSELRSSAGSGCAR